MSAAPQKNFVQITIVVKYSLNMGSTRPRKFNRKFLKIMTYDREMISYFNDKRSISFVRRVIIVIRDRKVSVKREKNFMASYFTNKMKSDKVCAG